MRGQCAINTIKSSENSACTAQAAWNWSFCLGYLAISGKFQTLLIYSVRLWRLHIKHQNGGPVRSSAVLAVTDFSQATTGSACTVMKLAAAQPFIRSWGGSIYKKIWAAPLDLSEMVHEISQRSFKPVPWCFLHPKSRCLKWPQCTVYYIRAILEITIWDGGNIKVRVWNFFGKFLGQFLRDLGGYPNFF